jgi:DNA-binding MarR family transcriptional regulator
MAINSKDIFAEELLTVPPLIFRSVRRKLVKILPTDVDVEISPLHFEIIALLFESGPLHSAEIGEKLQIARAQVTRLLDKLADSGIIDRQIDTSDRRMINVKLTDRGKTFFEQTYRTMKHAIGEMLSCLDERELKDLSDSLRRMREILSKLQ